MRKLIFLAVAIVSFSTAAEARREPSGMMAPPIVPAFAKNDFHRMIVPELHGIDWSVCAKLGPNSCSEGYDDLGQAGQR